MRQKGKTRQERRAEFMRATRAQHHKQIMTSMRFRVEAAELMEAD